MAIRLLGDIDNAAKYLSWAKSKLRALKMHLTLFGAPMGSRRYVLDDAYIYINTHHGWDLISIYGIGGGFLIISNPGVDTTDYTTRKYYNQDGSEIQLKTGDKPPGWQLLDDGTYGFTMINNPSGSGDDPEVNIYNAPSTDKGSMLVPQVDNGIAAALRLGTKNYRFVLNGAWQDEMWSAINFTLNDGSSTYSYNFLMLDDSLIFAPYQYRGQKPFVSRYVSDGIITATQKYNGGISYLDVQEFSDGEWLDSVPIVTRLYYQPFKPTGSNARRFVAVQGVAGFTPCLAIPNYYTDKRLTQDLLRGVSFGYTPSGSPFGYIQANYIFFFQGNYSPENMMEPVKQETYDLSLDAKPVVTVKDYNRGIDNTQYSCFFVDGDTISGKYPIPIVSETFGSFTYTGPAQQFSDTGIETIQDDVVKPYALKQDGSLTYVRMQKTNALNSNGVLALNTTNCGVYVAGKLIEESGFLPVITLYDDTTPPVVQPPLNTQLLGNYFNMNLQEVGGCPIYIRPVSYKILHAHHDDNWDVCVYKKTVYNSYEQTPLGATGLPYYANRDWYLYPGTAGDPAKHGYYQLRQTTIDSTTTFWIVVNGKKTQITYQDINKKTQPYQSTNHENQLTVVGINSTAYGSFVLPPGGMRVGMSGWKQEAPYYGDGFGGWFQGELSPWVDIDAGSVNITRIFTSGSAKHLLIGFDIFPVAVRHNLTYVNTPSMPYSLVAVYDDSVYAFPPTSDSSYAFPQDRKWLLLDTGGNLSSDIPTPKFDSGGGVMKNVQRINTLCLLEE